MHALRGTKNGKEREESGKQGSNAPPTPGVPQTCLHCKAILPSKTKLFKHLEEVHGIISNSTVPIEKAVLLFGWINTPALDDTTVDADVWKKEGNLRADWIGEVENASFEALANAICEVDNITGNHDGNSTLKGMTGSSSCAARASWILGQESSCHASSETICVSLKKLLGKDVNEWIKEINEKLAAHTGSRLRVLARQSLPINVELNCEMFCSQRLYEYIIPLSFLIPNDGVDRSPSISDIKAMLASKDELGCEEDGKKLGADTNAALDNVIETENDALEKRLKRKTWCKLDETFPTDSEEGRQRLIFLRKMKFLFKYVAGRRSFHNFVTGGGSPDEPTVKRRLDRMYHKDIITDEAGDKFMVISFSGDAFLRGQIRKLLGTVISIMRGWLPLEYLVSLFSEDDVYDSPAVPGWPLYLSESKYDLWEAKHMIRLDPRRIPVLQVAQGPDDCREANEDIFKRNNKQSRHIKLQDHSTVIVKEECCRNGSLLSAFSQLIEWKNAVRKFIMSKYGESKYESNLWLTSTKEKCAVLSTKYTTLKMLKKRTTGDLKLSMSSLRLLRAFDMNNCIVNMYSRVLQLLIEADKSGQWPATSTGRQKVITDDTLVENGTGGIGGSFSVGVYPKGCQPPKGNSLFPELLKSCFLLEHMLLPCRAPSSTIAINRNAQFRPHRDSGAGNGQSSSLIVGLGDYTGGELVVEGTPHDIRYTPLEFDGWSERHWTLPFCGNRYSLVWFTPLGVDPGEMFWLDEMMQIVS